MKKHIFKFIFFIAIVFFSATILAQDYQYEIGGMAGTAFYMGDANKTTLFREPGLAIGGIFRYNKNFRWAYKADLVLGKVSGDTRNTGSVFPENQNTSFSRTFGELGGQIEYNFFNYCDKYAFLGTKKISPYIFTGLGLTVATGDKFFAGLNIPLGVGVKYKVKERLNLGFEFSFRKLYGDGFDAPNKDGLILDNPLGMETSFNKNKDWYNLTVISLTWDFGERTRSCLNIE